jgi:hypothetical protein
VFLRLVGTADILQCPTNSGETQPKIYSACRYSKAQLAVAFEVQIIANKEQTVNNFMYLMYQFVTKTPIFIAVITIKITRG